MDLQQIYICNDENRDQNEAAHINAGPSGLRFANEHGHDNTYHVAKVDAEVMEYLWCGGDFLREIMEDKYKWEREHSAENWQQHKGNEHRPGVRAFSCYAAVDRRDLYRTPGEASPGDDASDVNVEDSAYIHVQANRDFIKVKAAPLRLRMLLRAVRKKNADIFKEVARNLEQLSEQGNALAGAVAEVIRAGGVFGAVSVHHDRPEDVTQERNDHDRKKNRHWDEITSLLHGAFTVVGHRQLAIWGTPEGMMTLPHGKHIEVQQEAGHFYLGNAANYAHSVHDRGVNEESLSFQGRLAYYFHRGHPLRHGFDIYNIDASEKRATCDAIAHTLAGKMFCMPNLGEVLAEEHEEQSFALTSVAGHGLLSLRPSGAVGTVRELSGQSELCRIISLPAGTFAIYLHADGGKVLQVDDHGNVQAVEAVRGAWEAFVEEPGQGDSFALKCVAHGGKYLHVGPGGNVETKNSFAGAFEAFTRLFST